MGAQEQWARLVDDEHVTALLVDVAAFLTAMAMVEDQIVAPLARFMADAERLGDQLSELDRRLAASDPDHPAAALADAADWFAEHDGLTAEQAARLKALAARRDQVARAPHRLLIEDSSPELLAAVVELRDLLHQASGSWFNWAEAGGGPPVEVPSMSEAVLAHIISVAQRAARP